MRYITEVLLNVGTLCFFLSLHSIAPYISQYAVVLGADEHGVALLGPALSLTAILLRPASGYLADRGLLKFLIIAGTGTAAMAQLLYWFSADVVMVYLGRCLQGVGVALFIPASIYTATLVGEGSASALAWRSTMIGLSMSLGPAIGGIIVSNFSYKALFATALTCLAISWISNSLALRELRTGKKGEGGRPADLLNYSFITASTAILAYSMVYNSLQLFLPAYHKSLGIDVSITSALFTTIAAANFATRIFFSTISKRVKYHITALAGFVLAILGISLIVLNPSSPYLIPYSVISGVGAGFLIPSLQILAVLSTRDRSRGLASGVYTAMFDLGNIIGPPLAISFGGTYLEALKVVLSFSPIGVASLLAYSLTRREPSGTRTS
jgi:MFS family permease